LFIWTYIRFNPGQAPYLRAWMASFVLIVLVLGLFTLARVLGARSSIEHKQKRAAKRSARRAAATDPQGVRA
jgi:HAMP domain-containing protein